MAKESGLNYFFQNQGLFSSTWDILYTFEAGAGTLINSISGAQSQFSGVLQNTANFWQKPGSGFFNGSPITIQNASGLYSPAWTMVFVYEKTTNNGGILFSSLNGTSGFQIGITDTNKPYFQTNNNGQIIVSSLNNYGSKNAVSFSYLPNYIGIGNYNFTSQTLEQEGFINNYNFTESDNWQLAPSWTGYMDYFMYFEQYYDGNVLNTLLSGLYNYPTGTGYNIQINCVTGIITGFQNTVIVNTGITGYIVTYNTGTGYTDYSGIFPPSTTQTPLTGILNSGLLSSGVTGNICYSTTGSQIILFSVLSGYVSSFGMDKLQLFTPIAKNDIIKNSASFALYDNNYNIPTIPGYSGFYINSNSNIVSGNQINMFLNGIAQSTQGWFLSGNNLLMTGVNNSEVLYIDNKVGNQNIFAATSGIISFPFNYSGQEIFFNGINLISGADYVNNGTGITLINNITGITGYIFEYPIVLVFQTGNYSEITGQRFDRGTSNVYLNGVRQGLGSDYVEGSAFDLFSGNYFNNSQNYLRFIYSDTNNFWIAQ
jgi:hypothetical protein